MNDTAACLAKATPDAPLYLAMDPRTGVALREASEGEREAYLAQPGHVAFRKPVRAGDVLVDEWTGYGIWFGGAGF